MLRKAEGVTALPTKEVPLFEISVASLTKAETAKMPLEEGFMEKPSWYAETSWISV